MRRRNFIRGIAASTAWALAARAQQMTMPVIGLLDSRGRGDSAQFLAAILQGLKDQGFVEGQNVALEYRFAKNHSDRLPTLAADLVHRQVTVIAALGTPATWAAKAATTTIPIVFAIGFDPVRAGLVASLNRPSGNMTGSTIVTAQLAPKRLELLHEVIPTARVMALLVNPDSPGLADPTSTLALSAAHTLGLELHVLKARSEREFDEVFANLMQLRAGGLVIGADPFFTARQEQLAALAVRHAVPAIYENREFVAAGGLMSYGASIIESWRLIGVYAGRILKGENPADLPVQQITKVEFYINLKSAKALGITIPLPLSGRADEVIE